MDEMGDIYRVELVGWSVREIEGIRFAMYEVISEFGGRGDTPRTVGYMIGPVKIFEAYEKSPREAANKDAILTEEEREIARAFNQIMTAYAQDGRDKPLPLGKPPVEWFKDKDVFFLDSFLFSLMGDTKDPSVLMPFITATAQDLIRQRPQARTDSQLLDALMEAIGSEGQLKEGPAKNEIAARMIRLINTKVELSSSTNRASVRENEIAAIIDEVTQSNGITMAMEPEFLKSELDRIARQEIKARTSTRGKGAGGASAGRS